MKTDEGAWLRLVQRLKAAYSTGGRGALGQMTPVEVHVLYSEMHAEFREVGKRLRENAGDELATLRSEKLSREISDVAGFIKSQQRPGRGRDR